MASFRERLRNRLGATQQTDEKQTTYQPTQQEAVGGSFSDRLRARLAENKDVPAKDRVNDYNHGVDVFNYTMDSWNRWYDASRSGLEGVDFGDAGDAYASIQDETSGMLNRLAQSRKWAQENKDLLGDNYDAILEQIQEAFDATYWLNRGYLNTVDNYSQWDSQEAYDQTFAPTAQEVIMGKDVGQMQSDLDAMARSRRRSVRKRRRGTISGIRRSWMITASMAM